ncbi:MAG: FxLYD domain-containing protein [Acidimicrobiales bacterium]
MSDTSQGEGWWQASDGQWYPPESHPDYLPPPPTESTLPPPPASAAVPSPPPAADGSTGGNGLAVAALVLGIIGAVVGLIPLFFFLAFILGGLALIFGLIGRKKGKPRRKMATWGAVLGLVAIILGIIGVAIVDDVFDDLDEAFSNDIVDDGDVDVIVETCGPSSFGAEATGTITNTSGKQQGFRVGVDFVDGGVLVGEGLEFVDGLAPGRTARWSASVFDDVSPSVACDVEVRYSIFDE